MKRWVLGCCLLWGTAPLVGQELVDIGGHRLEVVVRGGGAPTVVFESGQGFGLEVWRELLPRVAEFTEVLAYSRSGYGNSDPSHRRDAMDAVEELRRLLDAIRVSKPVILVGHSIGGWFVRTYAAQYPEEVAGLVLVDATAEGAYREWAARWPDFWTSYDAEVAPWLAEGPQASRDEEVFGRNVMGDRGLPEAMPLPDIPLAVITSTRPEPSWLGGTEEGIETWVAHHQSWVAGASRAIHIISGRTGHMVQHDEPELIVQAIRWVLDSVKQEPGDT